MNDHQSIQQQAISWIKMAVKEAGGEKELAAIIGVKADTVRSWVGSTVPSLRHLERVQGYLQLKREDTMRPNYGN